MCRALSWALSTQGTLGHLTIGGRGYGSHFSEGETEAEVRSLAQGGLARMWQSSDWNPDLFDSRALFSARS